MNTARHRNERSNKPVIHEPRNDERQLPLNSLARDIKDLPIEEWVTGLRRMQHLVKRLAWLACCNTGAAPQLTPTQHPSTTMARPQLQGAVWACSFGCMKTLLNPCERFRTYPQGWKVGASLGAVLQGGGEGEVPESWMATIKFAAHRNGMYQYSQSSELHKFSSSRPFVQTIPPPHPALCNINLNISWHSCPRDNSLLEAG